MKEIGLTQGHKTVVDDEDFEFLNLTNWHAYVGHNEHVYAVRNERISATKRTTLKMHRILIGAKSGELVDHINGNTLDNRKSNLRICNKYQSAQNRGKFAGTQSKFKGVRWHVSEPKHWQAVIKNNRKCISLGYFKSEIEAARVYDSAAIKFHGEFARTNESLGLLP